MTNPTPAQTPEPVCREARGCDQVVLCQPGCGARDLLAEATSPPPAAARLTAEAALDVVEAAFGDTLTPDARETALAGLAGLLAVPEATDRAGLRETIAQTLRPHASLGGAPPQWMLPLVDGSNPRAPRITGWRPLDAAADAVLAVVLPLAPTRTDTSAVLRDFADQLTDRLANCCTECDACAVIARDLADTELRRLADEAQQQPAPATPQNRRAYVHNAITDALTQAGDWVPLSVRTAATRAALAEVDAWHAADPAADQAQPGAARHVHITIHHPDPTTANTAALCIADLIRGEYGDSHRLTVTTDAHEQPAAVQPAAPEAPHHLGGKANAERCPACKAERRNPPYPWLCPADPGTPAAQQDGARTQETDRG